MPYTSVHFPSSHKTAHGNGHCHILQGGGGDKNLNLHVSEAECGGFQKNTHKQLSWQQMPYFTKRKIPEYHCRKHFLTREREKVKNGTLDLNDQVPDWGGGVEGEGDVPLSPLWITDLSWFHSVVNHLRDKFRQALHCLHCLSRTERRCFCGAGAVHRRDRPPDVAGCHHRTCFGFVWRGKQTVPSVAVYH